LSTLAGAPTSWSSWAGRRSAARRWRSFNSTDRASSICVAFCGWPENTLRQERWRRDRALIETACVSAIRCGLDAVQLGVRPAPGEELVVRADFDDAGAVEHHDQVGHAHRAEAVGNEEGDAAVGVGAVRGGGVALEEGVLGFG